MSREGSGVAAGILAALTGIVAFVFGGLTASDSPPVPAVIVQATATPVAHPGCPSNGVDYTPMQDVIDGHAIVLWCEAVIADGPARGTIRVYVSEFGEFSHAQWEGGPRILVPSEVPGWLR